MTSAAFENSRPAIDVEKLPSSALDYRSPIWWGNALLLCIETSMFALTWATYFYFRRNFEHWPPPKVDTFPPVYDPLPRFFPWAVPNLVVIVLSLVPMIIADRGALKVKQNVVRISATIALLMGFAAIYLRFREFSALVFRWDDNAYASICWAILGVHLLHLAVLCSEDGLMCAYIWIHGLDDKHARDIRVTAVYWYWVVAMWVISFAVIWISPRIM